MMNKTYKIQRITARGYKITILSERKSYTKIRATKNNVIIIGTINHVFKKLFGY